MAKPPHLQKPPRQLPRRQPKKKKRKKRKKRRDLPLLHLRRLLSAPHRRRYPQKTKRPVPPRWSARSPASTESASPKSLAPDLAAASPSRTSWPSSSTRRQPQPPPLPNRNSPQQPRHVQLPLLLPTQVTSSP